MLTPLRDDGVSYGGFLERMTYLINLEAGLNRFREIVAALSGEGTEPGKILRW